MKKIIVYGAGQFADIVTNLIEASLHREVAGYVLDNEFYDKNEYNGRPVVSSSNMMNVFPPEGYSAVLGFMGHDMFDAWERTFNMLLKNGYELENFIHPSAIISSNNIGQGNIILENCVIGYGTTLGNGNVLYPLTAINHNNNIGSFNLFASGVHTAGGTIIENHVFMGLNTCTNNKITIADYTFVGAGSHIVKSTEKGCVYISNAALKLNKVNSYLAAKML